MKGQLKKDKQESAPPMKGLTSFMFASITQADPGVKQSEKGSGYWSAR